MKPHKHAELIKAWADGAEVEVRMPGANNSMWHGWKDIGAHLSHGYKWLEDYEYRIKPKEIPQWRRDMAQAMNNGKEVEFKKSSGWVKSNMDAGEFLNPLIPFDSFTKYRIKPNEVAQWRKDLAKAIDDGGELQSYGGWRWGRSMATARELLDPSKGFFDACEHSYRIKPEPKPDVVKWLFQDRNTLDWYEGSENTINKREGILKIIRDGETNRLKSAEVIA